MLRYLPSVLAATAVLAKTDVEGCTSFTSTVTVRPSPGYGNTYETIIWYVPDTLEICQGVDCGGGRAPPRKVPGCPAYSGTETVTATFLATNPAAQPTAKPTVFTTMTSQNYDNDDSTGASLTPTRTSTIVKVVTTTLSAGEGKSTGQASGTNHSSHSDAVKSGSASGESKSNGTATATEVAEATTSVVASASGTQTGAEGASSTAVPGGAGPTARAGLAAMLGVVAAVAALA